MLRRATLLLLSALLLLLSGCTESQIVNMDVVKARYNDYENRIKSIDSTLKVYKSEHICENKYIVTYSIETEDEICYGVSFTYISARKEEMDFYFVDANDHWNDNNINLFANLIAEFSYVNTDLTSVKNACYSMAEQEYFRFNAKCNLSWDDHDEFLRYYEQNNKIVLPVSE